MTTRQDRIQARQKLFAELLEQGYQERAPGGYFEDIDASTLADSNCPNCGKRGLAYYPFFKPMPYSYKAFGCCSACGKTVEI